MMQKFISHETLQADTGKSSEQWMGLLEQEAAPSWSHEEVVDYLKKVHEVGSEWSELLALSYGQKVGRKPVGLTAATGYQIGVSRTFPISGEQAWSWLISPAGLKSWLGELEHLELRAGCSYRSADGIFGEIRVVKEGLQLRMTWQRPEWSKPSTIQIRVKSISDHKAAVSFHQENLQDLFMREQMKRHWEDVAAVLIKELGRDS
jgi:uncharacterized protein YndB with AHSA1/START domain